MIRLLPYAIFGTVIGFGVLYVMGLREEVATVKREKTELARQVSDLEWQRDQSRVAREVLEATNVRLAEENERYNNILDQIEEGEFDEKLPDDLIDILNPDGLR